MARRSTGTAALFCRNLHPSRLDNENLQSRHCRIFILSLQKGIPVFTTQLEKAKEATDLANVRSCYAEAVSNYLTEGTAATYNVPLTSDVSNCKQASDVKVAGVAAAEILAPTVNDYKTNCVINVSSTGAVTINGVAATTSTGTKQ